MDFILTTRRVSSGTFGTRQGTIKYLAVPDGEKTPKASHEMRAVERWFKLVTAESITDPAEECGQVVFFVHGFNTDAEEMLALHRKFAGNLRKIGFKGVCVSFDWPSNGTVTGYLSDRKDGRWAAHFLMDSGIKQFARRQTPDCKIDLCIVAHSMGCFVVREAFDFADGEHDISQTNWTVSQVAFVAADISSKSLALGDSESRSLLRHLVRLKNYWNPFDEILSLSSTKRVGTSRRLGRVGLPAEHSEKAVNLNCGTYYEEHKDDFKQHLSVSHSWYFDSPHFYEDLLHTLNGKLDRGAIPGRRVAGTGGFTLLPASERRTT